MGNLSYVRRRRTRNVPTSMCSLEARAPVQRPVWWYQQQLLDKAVRDILTVDCNATEWLQNIDLSEEICRFERLFSLLLGPPKALNRTRAKTAIVGLLIALASKTTPAWLQASRLASYFVQMCRRPCRHNELAFLRCHRAFATEALRHKTLVWDAAARILAVV